MPDEAWDHVVAPDGQEWDQRAAFPGPDPSPPLPVTRYRCTMCDGIVTDEGLRNLTPGLGDYMLGICSERDCWSNKQRGKGRGHSTFAPELTGGKR